MPSYKLTYFAMRGRAEPIRMLFALAEVPYENVRVPMNMEEWLAIKSKMPWGQMPVLEVDGKELPQTQAILRYLSKEYGFYGTNNFEAAQIDAIADQIVDFSVEYVPWYFAQIGFKEGDAPKLYQDVFLPARAKHFPIFAGILKKSKSGFLVGEKVSFADVSLAAQMEFLEAIVPESEKETLYDGFPELKEHKNKVDPHAEHLYDGFPELKALKERVFAIPAIAKHIATRPDDSR